MRVVFMGTPAFAVAVLRRLVEDRWDVAAVYSQPDKPKNRGMKLIPTPVKEYALTAGIPVFQPESCRDAAVLEQLRGLEPDVIVVAAYGKLLPQALLEIPKKAIINVHSSTSYNPSTWEIEARASEVQGQPAQPENLSQIEGRI